MKTLEQFIDDQISKIRLHDSETIDFWGDYFTENLDDVSDEDMRAEMENVIDLEPFRFEGKFILENN